MPDRYPKDSVLIPQWTRVDDSKPEPGESVTFIVDDGRKRFVLHGEFDWNDNGAWVFRSEYNGCFYSYYPCIVTHWSPRVGIPLPEEE